MNLFVVIPFFFFYKIKTILPAYLIQFPNVPKTSQKEAEFQQL